MKKPCIKCGTVFESLRPTRGLYCSLDCKRKYRTEQERLARKPYTLVCKNCGKEFKTRKGFMKFCCGGCREEWHKKYYGAIHRGKYRKSTSRKRRELYIKNREKIIQRAKEYYQAHRRERIDQKKQYKSKNRDLYNKAGRRRYAESVKVRIESSMSGLMRRSIRDKKHRPWESLVGYSIEDLMSHLERQFKPGMTWGNYGQWQIDHKQPRSKFTYTSYNEPQFVECWGLKNLQPLWKIENIRKGNRVNG